MLDLMHELLQVAILDDPQTSILDRHLQAAGHESADEHHLLGILADVDEAAGAGETWAEFADVQIALLVRLGKTEKRGIKAAAIVEVELIGLVDDGLRIDRGAEIEAACRHAADDPGSAVSVIRSMIFSSLATFATPSGMPMPRLTTLLAFSSSAARRAMIFRSFSSMGAIDPARDANLAAERRVVLNRECLPMMFGLGDDDTVDEDARNLDLPRVERAALGYSLHLHDDEPAGILHRHGDRQHFEGERFLFHGDVAVGIGGGAANDADIDRKCP